MLNLKKEDIKKLENIGSGAFGTVYRFNDDYAIKVYHDKVKTGFGLLANNPQLRRMDKAIKLKRINKKLEYTDLVQDLLYIDGKYAGIVIPYYEGTTLNHMMNAPIELKIDISKQLVRNCKELTSNNIYPLDFKLNNMMYVNGEVKFIDLDDFYTKYHLFNHERQKRDAICGLDESIKTYFGEFRCSTYNEALGIYLTRERTIGNYSYSDIDAYLEYKNKALNYLFIDIDSDIDVIKAIKNNGEYRIIMLYDSLGYDGEEYVKYFEKLDRNNIYVYDMIKRSEFDLYFSNNKIKNKFYIKERNCYLNPDKL